MTKKKRLLFALVAMALALFVSLAVLLAVDMYYHHKMSTSAGLNVWGYRGPTVGRKKPGERRVVVVGESTTFGYGVHWQETIPAYLGELLNQRAPASAPISVVNLGYNSEGARSYTYTLEDYAYLDADAVVFYSGYNDLGGRNVAVFRHSSPVFRLTGYMPILPLVIREKSMLILSGGDLEAAYRAKGRTIFTPTIAARTVGSALAAVASVSESLDRQLTTAMPDPEGDAIGTGADCGDKWAHYCGGMHDAVQYALDHGKRVLIVTQPKLNDNHVDQQRHLVSFLQHRFGGNPRLRFTSLIDALSLSDPAMCFDGVHLTAVGNHRIAERLAEPVSDLIR